MANNNAGQSPSTPSWVMWLLGSLVPFTVFTFIDERYRMITGAVALLMVAWAMALVSKDA